VPVEQTLNGIEWRHDPDEGFAQAKSSGKMVLLDFSAAPS
jgi:hypothetical protein